MAKVHIMENSLLTYVSCDFIIFINKLCKYLKMHALHQYTGGKIITGWWLFLFIAPWQCAPARWVW